MSTLQIIIPAYNAARFIAQTIDAVLGQSLAGTHVTVLDNASTDDTARIVEGYADRGVRLIRNPTNIGVCANHNLALETAVADYLKILSADDVLLPGVLARQKAALDAHPDVAVVGCNCIVTDNELRPIAQTHYLPGYWQGDAAIKACALKIANLIGAPSGVLMRRSIIGKERYDPHLKWMGDLDFVCRLLRRSNYLNIDEMGFLYRRHDATDSILSCPSPVRLRDEFAFARKYGGGLPARARIVYRLVRAKALGHPLLRSRVAR